MQRFKKPEFWAYPVLAVGLWAFFAFAMPDVLEFWEKNQLFRFSSDYWHLFDHEPFGTLIYLHTFLIQFNYYPWLGAIVYALLFTLTAWLFNRCVSIKGNLRLLPGLLTMALLLPTTGSFGLLVLLVVLFAVLGAHCWIYWQNRILRYSCQVFVLTGLTYLVREYMFWVLPFYMCLDWSRTRQGGQKFNPLFLLIPLIGTVLAWGLGTWFCAPYEFIYPKQLFHFWGRSFSPSGSIPYKYFKPNRVVFICMGASVPISFIWSFYRPNRQKFSWLISLLLVIGGLWITQITNQSISNFQNIDGLCRSNNWEKALHELDILTEKNPNFALLENSAQQLLCGQIKLALLATRKATSQLFTYPQPAFPLLFPKSISNAAECIILPTYYTFVGGISESLHMNYDLLTCHCISANVLNATILNSLIVGDTTPALKLTYFFEKTIFYQQQAAIYKDPIHRKDLPIVKRGQKMIPSRNYSVGSYEPDKNSFHRYFYQPDNPYFYEYFLCVCLLDKMHELIVEELPSIKKFYQKGRSFIAPRHIQEALLAYFDYNPSRFLYPQKIEGVSQETWNDYWIFIADNQLYSKDGITFSEIQKKWGHTYWFYDCYLKPAMWSASNQSIN